MIGFQFQFYGPHPLMRAGPYPVPPPTLPPHVQAPHGGPQGYTLPPTAAYFPMSTYSSQFSGPQQSKLLEGASLDSEGFTQPNTPDLLLHRRQVSQKKMLANDYSAKKGAFFSGRPPLLCNFRCKGDQFEGKAPAAVRTCWLDRVNACMQFSQNKYE